MLGRMSDSFPHYLSPSSDTNRYAGTALRAVSKHSAHGLSSRALHLAHTDKNGKRLLENKKHMK